MQRVQHRRFTDAAVSWPAASVMAGEVVVNPLRRALGVGDLDGTVRSIVDVRPFDARSQYIVADLVSNAGTIYRCKTAIGVPHAFNSAEWDPIGQSPSEMYPLFDARYAALDHNHDAVYSKLDHNHDTRYANIAHNHDTQYASISHNHDGVYAKLAGGNTFTGLQNFNDIVNMQGAYLAVFGSLSVASGSGGFVGGWPLHVRTAGMTVATIESTTANQVRLLLANSNRQHILYLESDGTFSAMYDLSAGTTLQKWSSGGNSTIYGTLTAGSNVYAPLYAGGPGDSGNLKCHSTANRVNFRWDGTYLYYRIDEVVERLVGTASGVNGISAGFRGPGATDLYLYINNIPYSDGTRRNAQFILSGNLSGPL